MHRHSSKIRSLAAAVAFIAGYVDAVGFLSLGGFFVSFMSGNSTRLGVGLAGALPLAARAAEVIAAFVVGVALGTRIGKASAQRQRAVLTSVATILLASALISDLGFPTVSAVTAALAMGAINAVFGREVGLPVGMTYVSGTLVRLGEALGGLGAGEAMEGWLYYAAHWCALVMGAAAGSCAFALLQLNALWLAAAGTSLLTLYCHRAGTLTVENEAPS